MSELIPLEQIAKVFNGKTPAKSQQRASGHPVLKIRDIDEAGAFRGPFASFVDVEFADKFAEKEVCEGDTLILNAAHNADYVGSKVALAKSNAAGALATGEWLIVRPTGADSRFVHYWLRSAAGAHALRDLVKGIHLYPKDVARLQVPRLNPSEQRRIADILDKADAIRRKRKEAIALTESLLRSTFLEMFGDPVTNPKAWPVRALGGLCVLVRGSSPRPKGDPRYFGGPVPRLMVADLTRDGLFVKPKIDSLTTEGAKLSRPVPARTIVMAVSGNVGVAAQLEVDACIHDGFVGFLELNPGLTSAYLLVLLRSLEPTWITEQAGAIFQNLTTTDVKRRLVPLPPFVLQEKFRAHVLGWLSLMLRQREAYRGASLSMESLVQSAFTGQPKRGGG